jgi:hypothetical protein
MMKKLYFFLILSLILGSISCDKTNTEGNSTTDVTYDAAKLTITVSDTLSSTAAIYISAKDIKGMGPITIGFCYSTAAEPTISDQHLELVFNADTLKTANLKLIYLVSNVPRNTEYFVKAYLFTVSNTYYSSKKSFTLKNNVLTIKVSSDFIPSGKEYWAVLSNKSTTLITQKLQNGQTYTFTDNIPSRADFHLYKWDATAVSLLIQSFTNVVTDNINLLTPYVTAPSVGQSTVTITDLANFSAWGVSGSWYWNATSTSTTKTLSTSLSKNPDNLFIYCLPSSGNAPLYINITGAIPGSTYTYTMSNLTAMTDYKSITLPANSYFTYSLGGLNTDYYTDYKRYHGNTYSSGYTGTFKLYYPVGIYTNYYFNGTYSNASQQSSYLKVGALPTTFFNTFPTITLTNATQFKTTTVAINSYADYEVGVLIGTYESSPLYIQWDYYFQPMLSNTVEIPELPGEIRTKIGNLSSSALSFANSGFIDISNSLVTGYDSYFDLIVKKSSRTIDVIKDRRTYYQWIDKKSSFVEIRDFEPR